MQTSPDELFAAALAGDPAPLVASFAEVPGQRTPLLRLLLAAPEDAPVSAVFAALWDRPLAGLDDRLAGLFSWYLRDETKAAGPARRGLHDRLLARVLAEGAPGSEAQVDMVCAAVRVAAGLPSSLARHRAAAELFARVTRPWREDPGAPPRPALIYAAIGTMDLGVIRLALARAGDDRPTPLRHALEWGVAELMAAQGGPDDLLAAAIARAHALDPHSPGSVHAMLWLGLREGRRFRDLAPMLQAMRLDRAEPQLKPALLHARDMARQNEAEDLIPWIEAQLVALGVDWTEGETRLPSVGAAPLPGPGAVGDLAAGIARATALAATDLTLGAALPPAALDAAFRRLVAEIETAPLPEGWTLAQVLDQAATFRHLTTREFGWVAHFTQTPHAGGRPEYGTLDLGFFPVLHRGMLSVSAAICRAGLARVEAGKIGALAWALARMMRYHTATAIEAEAIGPAHAYLDRIAAAGIMPDLVAVERDNIRLRTGDIAAADADPPAARQGSTVHPFLPRPDWSAAEAKAWTPLRQDPALDGSFGLYWPDGSLRLYPHRTPAREVLVSGPGPVSLLAEGLLIGPKGTMLKPDPYHTSFNYPVESRWVLAGQGRAVRIRPRAQQRHEAPVLLLDGLAALHWPNYYHWMITHLCRVALAAEAGLLDDRQVVFPEGMKSWTLDSLDLIGVTEAHRLIVPPSDLIRFDDAVILSSIEHLSPAALHALRRRLLGSESAAVTAPPADGRFYYLSRRNRALRKLLNEDEIEDIAREMGFSVIAPEDYTIAQQRGLFAAARGIAAPEGAALSNMIFAPPGARVLSMLCQNDMLPIFNDLALVLGQDHRKIAGFGLEATEDSSRFQPPYRIDPAIARRALAWVLEGDAA